MKHSTISDVAKKLGISNSTVSRALHNHPDISIETKALVKKAAKELNYIPNPIAQSLKNNRTFTIGIIVPEIKHDFFSSAISGIEEIAYNAGYTILVSQSNENYEREVINTNALINHRVAGVIVSISQQTKKGDHFKNLMNRGIPLVFFDRICEDVKANKVVINDANSAFDAVTFLIDKGYKKIAHFAGPPELDICKKRQKGYTDALKSANIPLNGKLIRHNGLHERDGYESMDYFIKENLIPDAIFAVNDPVAIGAFQRIKEAGLRIPQDIGIIGFSNNKITSLVEPAMTTVNQPSFEMGRKAAEILIQLIESGEKIIEPEIVELNADLVVRDSA